MLRRLWMAALALGAWACVPTGGGPGGGDDRADGAPVDARPGPDNGPEAVCGDGVCAPGEGCATCPDDCGCGPGESCDPADGRCAACAPACAGRACGDDGCGGVCGACAAGELCDARGACAPPPAACGDGACGDDEDCATCPADCGACCGDGQCGAGESCADCPADCGACCGDGACRPDHGEGCGTCPADCPCPAGQVCDAPAGRCLDDGPRCGDGACGAGESCADCPADCGACCGDGACDPEAGEGCGVCPADCGCPAGEVCDGDRCVPPPAACGDGQCAADESCRTCPADCGACCGDGVCTAGHGEDCGACPADCGCPAGEVCAEGACACAPRCDGRACGDDGCGGLCGECPADADCVDGACAPRARCGDGACDPGEDCAACAADCGCPAGEVCDPAARACACAPRCDGRVCGDDGCGGVCGQCPADADCVDGACAPRCLEDCGPPWTATCTADGFGLRQCAPDPERPGCTAPSRRIPCAEGRACADGACGGGCVVPEVMVLVDRSSSMTAGGRWAFARRALDDMVAGFGRRVRLGARGFPAEAANCAAGAIRVPALDNGAAFEAIPPPAQSAQTPILAAFDAVEPAFGDPDEGEAIVLITDGDETCADEDGVVARVEALRARGVRTFAVGISRQANGELLDRVAVAGGTARDAAPRYYLVEDEAALSAALGDIFARLEVCPCAAGDRRCDGDTRLGCRADLNGFEAVEACDFGCDRDTAACRPLCRPGGAVYACEGDRALACNAAGDGFGPGGEDCALGCAAPGGCFAVCRAGETHCVDADTVETCRADGSGWDAGPCPDICVLAEGACGASGACRPDDLRCDAAGLGLCDAQGAAFELAVECPGTCQVYNGRCPSEVVGDAYELDGVLYVRGPDGWGGVTAIDDWGVLTACFLLGYSSTGRQQARVPGAHPAGRVTYALDCAGAGWLGECEMVRSDRAGRAGDGVDPNCGPPRTGSPACPAEDVSFAYLGEGVHRPYFCRDGCEPSVGLCRAADVDCWQGLGGRCRLLEQEALVVRAFGARPALFDLTLVERTELEVAIFPVLLNQACVGALELAIVDEQGAEVHAAEGRCASLFSTVTLDGGSYDLTLSNPGTDRAYDLWVTVPVRGPRAP